MKTSKCKKGSYLNTVVASCNAPLLNIDMRWWMGKLALQIRACALSTLEFTANFYLKNKNI